MRLITNEVIGNRLLCSRYCEQIVFLSKKIFLRLECYHNLISLVYYNYSQPDL